MHPTVVGVVADRPVMGGLLAFGLSCFTGNAKTNARAFMFVSSPSKVTSVSHVGRMKSRVSIKFLQEKDG
jgi:hypothetical protein